MLDLKLLEKDFDSVAAKLKAKKVDENLLKNLQICFVKNIKRQSDDSVQSFAAQESRCLMRKRGNPA